MIRGMPPNERFFYMRHNSWHISFRPLPAKQQILREPRRLIFLNFDFKFIGFESMEKIVKLLTLIFQLF